jgi:hypothetical protein
MTVVRRMLIVVIAAMLMVACSDPLGGVGDLSRRVVHGDETSTTATTAPAEDPGVALEEIGEAAWINDDLDAGVGLIGRDALITAVWSRGDSTSSYIQASRAEIAAALPGIRFPRLVPTGVGWISSQLVYDRQSATLDPATAAAFGMWSGVPYSAPRNEAQLAVLRVGLDSFGDIEEGDVSSFRVAEGRELSWAQGGYVYQLFCRTGVTEASCFAMAESTGLLSLLDPEPDAAG